MNENVNITPENYAKWKKTRTRNTLIFTGFKLASILWLSRQLKIVTEEHLKK